jgi:hypothetical protein
LGLLDWFTGNRGPDPGSTPCDKPTLMNALLSLNRDDIAWRIIAAEHGRADLIVQWKADDPKWTQHLRLLEDLNDMLMRLDETSATVRAVDTRITVDIGLLSISASGFRGQENEAGRNYVLGRKPDGKLGFIETDRVSTNDFKRPIRDLVAAHGWSWKGVVLSRL